LDDPKWTTLDTLDKTLTLLKKIIKYLISYMESAALNFVVIELRNNCFVFYVYIHEFICRNPFARIQRALTCH